MISTIKKPFLGLSITSLLLLLIFHNTEAQSTTSKVICSDTIQLCDDLFNSEEVLEFIIKFNIKEFQKTRMKEDYHPAKLTWVINDSLQKNYDIRIKTRGFFRKKYCYLPPFWLNIKHSGIDFPPGEEITKMKVVTHCNRAKNFNDYILKEYLTYKLYNLITPLSFQVRLVKMTYIDEGRENKESTKWAFIIEPNSHLINRLDGVMIENDKLSMKKMNAREMDRLAHFQYMIGNADYSITGRHNIKIIELVKNNPSGKIPIPYDFDYTGIVNTSYATPSEQLGISSVRERYFLGPCRANNIHQEAIDNLIDMKHDLEELIETFEYLSISHKIEMLKYIESYYTSVSKDTFIEWKINNTCR